ncbi:MAG: hypothetical protein UV35_C0023G0019 [candidate division WWE3 bacterium GW2011_GWB1_42_6]|uniref:FAD-binding FR-type domain-containing protein n=1 Tax=candidate division WWE3 bacterium GW2011_GWB1_42_6 TaxID=1619115 RepID=A0A0G1D5R1_UNCKA|nr:MAG: hypothetical protein UV35_C0023G0019 [candidate division WWE3 bacterium GW2011_GWB1_42_6]
MDKIYKIHRKVSEIGFVLIILHPLTLALSSPEIGATYFFPVHTKAGVNLGVYSFWVFVTIILITLLVRNLKIPYHIWKQTHKFLNLAMALALVHVVTIQSDTSSFEPLGIWMKVLTGLGVASGLYMTFFYNKAGPRYEYEIVEIKRYGDIHDVFLKPIKHKLPYKLAQYVYVSFISEGISKETHPYCIMSLPQEDILRFSIKELGDYTKKLGKLKVGDKAIVHGPYGHLSEKFVETDKDSVFIAGGIGIAPFVSMFKQASINNSRAKVTLFYCTKYKKEASFEDELIQIAAANDNLKYYNQCSREINGGHLSIEQITSCAPNTQNTNIYLCGPTKMMEDMATKLIKAGFNKQNIILENFEML